MKIANIKQILINVSRIILENIKGNSNTDDGRDVYDSFNWTILNFENKGEKMNKK